ncbi:MAG: hypothetical protein U5K36_04935 [Roseovarius sp.]|nr:hypothetical protein [Roseovarius sp.]
MACDAFGGKLCGQIIHCFAGLDPVVSIGPVSGTFEHLDDAIVVIGIDQIGVIRAKQRDQVVMRIWTG